MNNEKKYLVRDPTTGFLNLSEMEHDLVGELMRAHRTKFRRILRTYYDSSSDKIEFIERLDEIFTFYLKADPNTLTPFVTQPELLDVLFDLLEEFRNDKPAEDQSQISENKKESLKFEQVFEHPAYYRYIIDELSKPERGPAFDSQGRFVRENKQNSNIGYCTALLQHLKKKHFLRADIIWSPEFTAKFIKDSFDVEISTVSSTSKTAFKKHYDTFSFLKLPSIPDHS